jgi:hypothetical protein
MLPLLHQALSTTRAQAVPTAILDTLRDQFFANARDMLRLADELLNLLQAFAAHGVQAVPFKGPALAASAYGSLTLRHCGDLDVLVRPRDLRKARAVLDGRGYRACGYADAYEQHFVGRGDEVNVDLHWRLHRGLHGALDPPRRWWLRRQPLALAGGTVLTFAPEESLLMLGVNAAKVPWQVRLCHVCDVAEHIRAHPRLDWAWLLEQARFQRGQRLLYSSLVLAHDLVGTSLPAEVWRRVRALPAVRVLAGHLREQLFQEFASPSFVEVNLWQLRRLDGLRDRVPYACHVLRQLATPNEKDRALLALPAALSFLYYLLRPVRLVRQHGVSLFRLPALPGR